MKNDLVIRDLAKDAKQLILLLHGVGQFERNPLSM
jgi:predicted esterase